jgi:putative ATP-binding cassette transporter
MGSRIAMMRAEELPIDEATSALDEAMEERVYALLVERLPHAAVLSVAARPGAARHLPGRWTLADRGDGRAGLEAA